MVLIGFWDLTNVLGKLVALKVVEDSTLGGWISPGKFRGCGCGVKICEHELVRIGHYAKKIMIWALHKGEMIINLLCDVLGALLPTIHQPHMCSLISMPGGEETEHWCLPQGRYMHTSKEIMGFCLKVDIFCASLKCLMLPVKMKACHLHYCVGNITQCMSIWGP